MQHEIVGYGEWNGGTANTHIRFTGGLPALNEKVILLNIIFSYIFAAKFFYLLLCLDK